MDLDDVKGNDRSDRAKVGDLINVLTFPHEKWTTVRLNGKVIARAVYWVKTKKKDGKFIKFPIACPSWDATTQSRDATKYDPWRDIEDADKVRIDAGKMDKEDARVQFGVEYWINGLSRAEVKRRPSTSAKPNKAERASGFKEKDSDSWTPWFGVKMGKSLIGKIKNLKGLNTIESAKTGAVKSFSITDPKFGRDVRIHYDKNAAPADQYQVAMGDKRTPLTEEELSFLQWDLTAIEEKVDPKTVKSEFESWATRNGVKLKAKPSKADEDEDDESEDDEDMDDEDEAPARGKKKPAPAKKAAKKRPVEDDEDEEDEDADEDDFDDEDEEDEPAPKKGKAPGKKAVKKKPVDDDEDDEDESEDDEDDFDDEDDEDEPAPKKGKAAAKKAPAKKSAKKPVDDDDFDDEDEADDDDESEDDEDDFDDDEPAPKKAVKKGAAPAKKAAKKRPVDDDEDDEEEADEDDFDDEDEEDEPAPKRPAKKAVKKAPAKKSAKKRPADDEDDDDF